MKNFFRKIFEIFNFIAIAAHSLAKELPALVTVTINEIKDLFKEDQPKLTKKTDK